ncbi:MAG: Crp/Fnr family transcriptional regulator [Gammaproteobacteria bacterium]|nr:Crp/Fnr family transcriptional regulator [Gammaproteobacteria bacterium]
MIEQKIEGITKQILSLSNQTLIALAQNIKEEAFTKNEVFISLNEPNENEYFIYDGICRSFLYTSSGAEVTLQFFMEKSVLSPNIIRSENNLSNQNIQALTDVTGFSINRNKFRSLMNQFKDLETYAHMSLQLELKKLISKESDLITLSAKNRLLAFRRKYPKLEQLVSHSHIASYLGITTVSLSRLRAVLNK